jgi:hypothetical protein
MLAKTIEIKSKGLNLTKMTRSQLSTRLDFRHMQSERFMLEICADETEMGFIPRVVLKSL